MKKNYLFTGLGILMVFSSTFQVQGQSQGNDKIWTGNQDNNWNNPNNWDPAGVPTRNDDVTINQDAGSTIVIDNTDPSNPCVANSVLLSQGTMVFNSGSHLSVESSFVNGAKVSINTNAGEQGAVISGSGSETEINNTVNGQIEGTFGSNLSIVNVDKVENHNTISAQNVSIETNTYVNSEGAATDASQSLTIQASNNIENNGTLIAGNDNGGNEWKGNLTVSANILTNNGQIMTKDRDGGIPAGDVNINANALLNNVNGQIASGKGNPPETGGKINIRAKITVNHGKIRSGFSPGDHPASEEEQYFNNVSIFSDTLTLSGDSVLVEADTLRLYFNYLKIEDVTQYACIWGDMIVEFYGSLGAVADLSSPGNGQGIISVGYGGISFFCDNILEPPLGLNYVCDLPPTIAPSDTTILAATVINGIKLVKIGTSGSCKIPFQNQSTLPRSFEYTITDQKGWVQDATGTTSQVQSFQFDSLTFSYTIPNLPDSVPDTIFIILSHGGESILAEAIWVLYSYQEPLSGVWEADGKRRDLIETFPVPFADDLNIRALEDVFITILDPMGRVILREQIKKSNILTWIPAGNYTGGLYLIAAENERTGTEVDRVIYQPE
jgi:hypothetical protein